MAEITDVVKTASTSMILATTVASLPERGAFP